MLPDEALMTGQSKTQKRGRNLLYNALVLRVRAFGESNREAVFLTAEEGLIRAAVFGGPKSHLRAQIAPFHSGKLWIYYDPVRDSRKVNDFDVSFYRMGIRTSLERVMAADAIAETILFSQGGGSAWQDAIKLTEGVLDFLDNADPTACTRITIYFLWHWAKFLGSGPEIELSCACEPKQDGIIWYSEKKEGFYCEKCKENPGMGQSFPVGPGAVAWLKRIESLFPTDLARVTLDTPSLNQAKALSLAIMAGALGRRLSTWEGI